MSFFKRIFKAKEPIIDENDLLKQYRLFGNLEILGKLYQPYTHLVFGVCMKYLKNEENSQDAVMQIFEKLVLDLRKHEVVNFKSWLFVIAKNFCLQQLRSKEPATEEIKNIENDVELSENLHHEENENRLIALEKAIVDLPAEQKTCIELFYLKEKCYKEIVEETGFDLGKVKSYIQNGKRNLKLYLEKQWLKILILLTSSLP